MNVIPGAGCQAPGQDSRLLAAAAHVLCRIRHFLRCSRSPSPSAWPPTYRAAATILIEQQEIPQDLVRSAISSFADERVQIISQRVMTTQNLMSLIDRYNLYPDIRESKPREVLLQKMRSDIALKMVSADVIDPRSGRPTQATIAFTVSYQNRSPDLTLKVANELTTLYLNENLTSRTQMAEQTTAFFAEETGQAGGTHRRARQEARRLQGEAPGQPARSRPAQRADQRSHRARPAGRGEPNRRARRAGGAAAGAAGAAQSDLAGVLGYRPAGHGGGRSAEGASIAARRLQGALRAGPSRCRQHRAGDRGARRRNLWPSMRRCATPRPPIPSGSSRRRRRSWRERRKNTRPEHPDVVRLTHLVDELKSELAAHPASSDVQMAPVEPGQSRLHPGERAARRG